MKLICFLAYLCLVLNSCAQQTDTKPLNVGDTIPHIILTDVVNFPVSEIQLSSHQNKLIIIDFWGRYCIPCLQALPKYDSLQQAFKDSILIITASDFATPKEFAAAKQKFSFLQQMHLPVLLQSNPLVPLFPFKLLSHIVWIGPGNVVKAITGAEHLTATNIRKALSNEQLNWPVKRDMVDFDYQKPLLTIAQPVEPPTQLYYSSFTSFIEGIAPPGGTNEDHAQGIAYTAFYNYDLLSMAKMALSYRVDAARDQFVLRVKDTTVFVCNNPAEFAEWKKQHSWCYYLRTPIGINAQRTRAIVQADLLRWLNILGYSVHKENCIEENKLVERYIITDTHNP
jgi:thiol-disulfide isomerase/thioredoxin